MDKFVIKHSRCNFYFVSIESSSKILMTNIITMACPYFSREGADDVRIKLGNLFDGETFIILPLKS